MSESDRIFMEELKEEFKQTVTKNITEMQTLYKENKLDEIAKIAHDIKGMAGIFDLDEGTEIAKELQVAAQDKDSEKTKELIEQLARYMKENAIIE